MRSLERTRILFDLNLELFDPLAMPPKCGARPARLHLAMPKFVQSDLRLSRQGLASEGSRCLSGCTRPSGSRAVAEMADLKGCVGFPPNLGPLPCPALQQASSPWSCVLCATNPSSLACRAHQVGGCRASRPRAKAEHHSPCTTTLDSQPVGICHSELSQPVLAIACSYTVPSTTCR